MKVTARYAHDPCDTPGTITLEGTKRLIKVKARSFVEDGFRNQTWITVDFGDHTYSVRNVHAVRVVETTAAAMKVNVSHF